MATSDPVVWDVGSRACGKCKQRDAVLIARREPYCGGCFVRFIRGKQRKPMAADDRYRVRYQRRPGDDPRHRVAVAALGGVSLVVLVDCVAGMLQDQAHAHKGRTGFELVVVTIATDDAADNNNDNICARLHQLAARFPEVSVVVKQVPVAQYIDDKTLYRLRITPEFAAVAGPPITGRLTVGELLAMCVNKLSGEDLLEVVRHQLLLEFAVAERCHTVLYGHSLTRIASDIIALTVKGRGLAIYRSLNNRTETVAGAGDDVVVMYPLRDVLGAEVSAYATVAGLDELVTAPAVPKLNITKNLTIRDLTANYFARLEATGYALTALAVVKIGDKLAPPPGDAQGTCGVCGIDVYHNPQRWLQRITVERAAPLATDDERANLAAYEALAPALAAAAAAGDGAALELCYGCTVSLKGAAADMAWPVNPERLGPRYNADDVINELSLE